MTYGPSVALSKEIHAEKYRGKNETFEEAQTRFANTLKDSDEHFRSLRDILLHQRFMGGGRTQAAIGAPRRVTAFNCFVSGTIEDSFDSIMDKVKEAGQTMRLGGGIGYDFSTLRPRGDNIVSLDSSSSGPLSFMEVYDALCSTVSSSGHRRGAQMGVLRVDHPDIEEFIRAKQDSVTLTRFNLSIGITDEFMYALEKKGEFELKFEGRVYKTVDAAFLWEEIMRSTWDWAEPGVLFIDTINKNNNLHYCETIAATNPCLHPDSMVETTEGRVRIADMNKPMHVYTMGANGELTTALASPSFISKHGAETVNICIDSGKTLRCTPDHKVWSLSRGWVEASSLLIGERVGHLCRTKKSEAYSRVKLNTDVEGEYAPEHRFVASTYINLCDLDDVHHLDEDTYNNSIDNLEVLTHEDHSILTNTGADKSSRGLDGKFVKVTCKKRKHNIPMPDVLKSNLINQFSGKVVGITEGATTDVYDIIVEGTHNFIADFIVVHNCGEQPLPPYGACLLGSFNLVKYIKPIYDDEDTILEYVFNFKQLREDIPHVVRAMDNIHDNTVFPLPEQAKESADKRRMGLGVTALANAGEIIGYEYGSEEFLHWAEIVFTLLRDEVYDASIELAKEKGSFPLFDSEKYGKGLFIKTLPARLRRKIHKHGIRNSHLLSFAPTGTISLSADNVSGGIEPVFSHSFDRTIQTPDGARVEQVEDYAYKFYGVEGKKATDCTAQEHLDVLSLCSRYVDSAVSKTINVSPSISWDNFKAIYYKAWESGCRGCTTFNPDGKRYGILNEAVPDEEVTEACYINLETGQKECS